MPLSVSVLASLLEQAARRLHSQGYAADLFPAQWAAIRYFDASPPHLRTAIDLARFQGLASGAVARSVRTLIAKGLAVKAGTIGRGRAEQVDLTEAGRKLLARDPLLPVRHSFEALDADERAALAHGLQLAISSMKPEIQGE